MPRSKLAWNVVWLLAMATVIGTMCLVAKQFIVTPFSWMRPVSSIYLTPADARPVLSVVVERQSRYSGNRSVRYGSRARGISSPDPLPVLGPSRSVGIMCSYYGSTSAEIDIWLQILTLEDGGHVYMCDL